MARRIAYKRLSAVEVDPGRSHQHELNATLLMRQLGLDQNGASGALSLTVYLSDEPEDVLVDNGQFTLYDSRKGKPHRSAEYRLYYDTPSMAAAQAGDLLLMFSTTGSELAAVVARAGTQVEQELARALVAGDDIGKFRFADDSSLARAVATRMTEAAVSQPATPPGYPELASEFIEQAVAKGVIPGSAVMADAAQAALRNGYGTLDPDSQLYQALEAETDIYFALEERIQGARLSELQDRQASLTEVLAFAQSLHQSRKSRRGQSLQNHFAHILDAEAIPYTPQCVTEAGERPDFVIPGHAEYHDPAFPADRLRLVACKSTAKERWRQVLNEAARVPTKYLLTVDRGLTSDTLLAMQAAQLRVFLPAALISANYAESGHQMGTVSELIGQLRTKG